MTYKSAKLVAGPVRGARPLPGVDTVVSELRPLLLRERRHSGHRERSH